MLRRKRRGEPDGERWALAVLGAGGALALIILAENFSLPPCAFHAITGLPCLTCGGTRCLRSLLAGHPLTALEWNPLVFAATVAALLFGVYAATVTAFRLPRLRLQPVDARASLLIRRLVALGAAANWIYLVFRLSRGA